MTQSRQGIASEDFPGAATLARIDERTIALQIDMGDVKREQGVLRDTLFKNLSRLEEDIEKRFVLRQEFNPVRLLVYGFVGTVLTAVLGALLALVVIKPGGGGP